MKFYEVKNLPCKSKMASYYVFATAVIYRRLLPLNILKYKHMTGYDYSHYLIYLNGDVTRWRINSHKVVNNKVP